MNIIEKVTALLESPQYAFLKENEYLGDRIIFLTLGGSHAYGTNIETSDVDIRGVCHQRPQDLIGLSQFEQVVDNATDTTIYGFNKLINLILNCNPNTIELLGCKPEHYFVQTDIGRELIANRKMFLSKRAVNSFGDYANQQLRRLQNAVARDKYSHNEKEQHIKLNKHAMHLVRLYLMCFDILEKEEIITYRENDLDLLMSIRNGKFQNPGGTYQQDFFALIADFEKRLQYAAENTSLPKNPDYKQVEEFVMSVNRKAVLKLC